MLLCNSDAISCVNRTSGTSATCGFISMSVLCPVAMSCDSDCVGGEVVKHSVGDIRDSHTHTQHSVGDVIWLYSC